MTLAIPRDRLGSFEPQRIAKYQRRMAGFDENGISMYARGMTTRQITGHLLDIYGMEVSPELISTITNEVLEKVRAWQNRPLEAIYQALGVASDGRKSVLDAWKDRKAMAGALKTIYQAPNADAAHEALIAFGDSDWGRKFPSIVKSWQRQWEAVIPFFAYPPEVRRILHTTNAIESLHMRLRKTMKSRGQFPSDDAALKLIFLNLHNIEKEWKMPTTIWATAKSSFAILFGERFTDALT